MIYYLKNGTLMNDAIALLPLTSTIAYKVLPCKNTRGAVAESKGLKPRYQYMSALHVAMRRYLGIKYIEPWGA